MQAHTSAYLSELCEGFVLELSATKEAGGGAGGGGRRAGAGKEAREKEEISKVGAGWVMARRCRRHTAAPCCCGRVTHPARSCCRQSPQTPRPPTRPARACPDITPRHTTLSLIA